MAWAKPTSVSTVGTCNYTNGGNITIRGTRNYYVYMGGSWSGYQYYRKTTIPSSGVLNTFIDDDRSLTSSYKEFQIILSSTDLGAGPVRLSDYGTGADNYVAYLRVPRYAATFLLGHDPGMGYIYNSYENPSISSFMQTSGYTYIGLTQSKTSFTASYGSSTNWSSAINEGTWYGLYSSGGTTTRSTGYYYRGTSSRQSVTITKTSPTTVMNASSGRTQQIGSGSTSIGSMSTSCLANSSASLLGWATSSSSTSVGYSDAEDAFNAGYSTIYGVYRKSGSTSRSTCYYYRGSSTRNSVTKTTSISDAYYYGTGRSSGGTSSTSYGSMTTTCASDSSYSLVGWATSSGTTSTSYSSANSAFNAGNTTIYGVYRKNGSSSNSTVYYYRGNGTRNSVTKTTTTTDAYYYGTGSHSGGTSSNSYGSVNTACAVSGWTYLGFASNSTTTSSSSSATSLWNSGYTTIYGTYSKTESMTYYPQNGSPSSSVSTTNYRYGTGSVTNNRPSEPSLVYAEHTFQGWGTSSTDETPEPWDALWDAGTRAVYAIWLEDYVYNVYYGLNGEWKQCKVYFGNDGQWKEALTYYGANGSWKQ